MGKEFSFDSNTAGEAEEISSQMPEPSEHALSQMDETSGEETSAAPQGEAPNVDDFGTVFDPEKHTGTKLKNGRWRERKKSTVAAPRGKKNEAPIGQSSAIQADANAEAMATGQVIATMFLGACQSLGGEEWEPTKQERDFQTSAWQAYCVAKGVKELSPGLALMVAIGSYAAPRFAKPKTSAKLGAVKTWFALRIARMKIRSELKKRGIKAEVTIRDGDIYINGTSAESWSEESNHAKKN